MIHVLVTGDDGQILAEMNIERLGPKLDDVRVADYSVTFGVERGSGQVGLHQRLLPRFERLKYNALSLVAESIRTLGPEELELEDGATHHEAPRASDLERQERGAGSPIPREAADPVRHHRSAFWRKQPKQ